MNGYLLILPIFRVISILSNIKQKEEHEKRELESHHQFPHHDPHRRPQCLLRTELHPTLSGIADPLSKQGGITPHKQSLLCCVDNHRQPLVGTGSAADTKTLAEL